MFISPSLAQLVAYFNLVLVVLGVFLLRKNIKPISSINSLWFVFYLLYYTFGLLALGMSGFQTSIIASLIPLIYLTCFYFLLSDKEEFKMFFKLITFCFVLSSFITIIFIKLNINLKTGEIHGWDLDRAGGVTGDANAAAITSIFAYILFNHFYKPSKQIYRILKVLVLLTIFYSLFLTFSTTGLFVFSIVFFITNYKFFSGIKLVLFAAMIPLFYVGLFALQSQTQNLGLSSAQTFKINNLINVLTLNFDKVDSSGRGDLLQNVLYYLYENPIIGNGVDFAYVMRGHNTYIGIWVDAGIFTFVFFIFILFYYFFKAYTLTPKLRFFAMSILITLYVFMVSLQSVLNKPYLIVIFVFVGYLIDHYKLDKRYTSILQKKET
jgi:O-antigen ligase